MRTRDIVLIGASSGGIEALRHLLPQLPPDLAAAIFVIVHVPARPPSVLHTILQPRTTWPVLPAIDGATIRQGVVTVAVSDHHLLFEGDHVRLTRGPRENRSRPSIDASLRSAAVAFGPRCIGIILTGNLDDGTAGLWALKDRGGVAIVQSPEEAETPSMPRTALANVSVDHVVTLKEIPGLLATLTSEELPRPHAGGNGIIAIENQIAAGNNALQAGVLSLGQPSFNTCPHCHGTLMEVSDAGPLRYRCHTGHAFSAASLLVDLDRTIDDGLWSVLRSLDERLLLLQQLVHNAKTVGDVASAQEYTFQQEDARKRSADIRGLLTSSPEVVAQRS